MSRPRVILADTDESYVAPLETKFINELGDRIDFEIITEPQYLASLFSAPQHVDILIIAEGLYNQGFSRHDIGHTFVMVENPSECRAINDRVAVIFKYSSLKEIYSHIMTICSGTMKMESITPEGTRVIMLYSVPGGVGKTTLGLGLAACIAQNYKRVLYINAARINSFQCFLRDQSPMPVNVTTKLRGNYENSYDILRGMVRNEYFDYLPPFHAALSTIDVDYAVYKEFIRRARIMKNYDYIIVDADSVLDRDKSEMIAEADKVIVVTKQGRDSVYATNLITRNINCNDHEKFFYICNDYREKDFNAIEKNTDLSFQVDEYVRHIENIGGMTIPEIGMLFEVQKITFLVV